MDVAEALRRRRTSREFLPDPVPAELLERLAEAANRAPTASNVPYREVMLVDDRRIIKAVRQISPAMVADPPALVVILTDVELAVQRIGPVGRVCSFVDSGAAGENVWLAATEAGLGAHFTMISAMPGIRVVLGLPERMRVDLMMPVGYPAAARRGTGVRARRRPPHHNQYGREYEPA